MYPVAPSGKMAPIHPYPEANALISPDDITKQELSRSIDHPSIARGLDYFERDRAALDDVIDEIDQVTIHAHVLGSGGHVYSQNILLIKTDGLEVDGNCSCPVGFNCKHVVAACFLWKEMYAESFCPDSIGSWLDQLVQPAEKAPDEIKAGEQALLYELGQASLMSGKAGLAVGLCIARRKKNGEWGKGRTVSALSVGGHRPFGTPQYLQKSDLEITALLRATDPTSFGSHIQLHGVTGRTALQMMLASNRLFIRTIDGRAGPLRVGAPRSLGLDWQKAQDGLYRLGIDTGVQGGILAETTPPHYVDLDHLEIGPLELPDGLPPDALSLLESAPAISEEEAQEISDLIASRHPGLPTPKPVAIEEWREPVRPRLRVRFSPSHPAASTVDLDMLYGDVVVFADSQDDPITVDLSDRLCRIHRDVAGEERARETLESLGLRAEASGTTHHLANHPNDPHAALARWMHLFEEQFPRLEAEGWQIEMPADDSLSLRHGEQINADVEQGGNDWFDLRFDLMVDGNPVPLLPLVDQILEAHEPGSIPETLYLETEPGQYIKIAGEQIAPVLDTIVSLHDRQASPNKLRLARPDAPRLLELGDAVVRGGEDIHRLARQLRGFDGLRRIEPPDTFRATLRHYQKQGLDWLQFLREYELGGILADDMGLGKTVQTLAHLAVEKHEGRLDRPALIVAPTSLMGNWRREAERFAPNLDVTVFHGPDRRRHVDDLDHTDVVLTSYPLLPRDKDVLSTRSWHYVILDEAQQIKNPRSQAAQLVRALDTRHRLCLTGTPMENHLGELWAQFDFLMPGFLGDRKNFVRNYRTPVEKHGDQEALERLKSRIRPFALRRTKDRVANELPDKTEMVRTVPLGGRQATLYESIRLTMEKRVRDVIAQKGLARSHITVLDALLKLRQVCCDPRLLPKETQGTNETGSAKLALLMELLPEMLEEGRRILLFSQFTTMLGLIEQELKDKGIRYSKLTGKTKHREDAIDCFRRGEVDLFLISLKAGGVGLNLTEADTVIHFDPWWNPAAESQATDRAHRIGQEKPVFVYKLITEGTIEEKILGLQAKKQQLVDTIHGSSRGTNEPPIDEATIQALLEGN